MKKSVFFALMLALPAVFCACRSERTVTLVMSEPNPADSISARVDEVFVRKVEELSKGSVKIQLSTDGALGDNTAIMKVITRPDTNIHIARVSPAALSTYGCGKHELMDVPYTFRSHNHFWNFAASGSAQEILNEPYEKNIGVKGLYFAEEGFRHFFSTKELNGIEDFEGEKIRSAGNSVMNEVILALKGEPVTVTYSNLYSSLQTGVVNIAEQPIENYLSSNFSKVAPYMILDGHQLGLTEVVISSQVWDGLSKEHQEILVEAGRLAGEFCKIITLEAEESAKDALRKEGVRIAEVSDISKWQEACADVINSVVKNHTILYGEIITLAD